ncbi:MAG: hypothetical protein J6V90_07880 [Treponema sp.]|nr:hypothetical protein [Treponema sp.]
MVASDSGTPMMVGDGFCGGGFIWAFLIFALLMGNGGFGFGGNGNSNALQNDINRGFENQNTQANQREILSATNQVYHDIAANLGDKYAELARDIAGVNQSVGQVLANQCQLNGDLKLQVAETGFALGSGIAQNRYDAAMNTAAINANTTAQTQKILDAMAQNKIETLQSKVNYLETQNLLGNVVRYPSQTVYSAGGSPFCNCGNGFGGYPLYA